MEKPVYPKKNFLEKPPPEARSIQYPKGGTTLNQVRGKQPSANEGERGRRHAGPHGLHRVQKQRAQGVPQLGACGPESEPTRLQETYRSNFQE